MVLRAVVKGDDVAGLQARKAQRQVDPETVAPRPEPFEHGIGEMAGGVAVERAGQAQIGDPGGRSVAAPRAGRPGAVIPKRVPVADDHLGGQLVRLAERPPPAVRFGAQTDAGGRHRVGRVVTGAKPKARRVRLAAVGDDQAEGVDEGFERVADAGRRVDRHAEHRAPHALDIGGRQAMVRKDRPDQAGERSGAEPAVEPVPGQPVLAVAPDRPIAWKGGKGPGVPGPQEHAAGVDHRVGRAGRERVGAGAGQRPAAMVGLKERPLGAVAARARGVVGPRAFGGFGIGEDVGLVGPGMDGRAAQFGQPYGLGVRGPGRLRPGLDAAAPVDMDVRPPGDEVLVAIDPGLAVRAVGDRGADAGVAVRGRGVIPVEPLAGGDGGPHGAGIVMGGHAVRIAARVGRVRIAPVGERHVVVDADRVDLGRRPQRVQMVVDVARAVGGVIAEIFGPVGAVGQPAARPQERADIGGEPAQRVDEGERVRFPAQPGQPAQFRADQHRIDPAGDQGQPRHVQHHAPIAPVGAGTGDDRLAVDAEIGGRGAAGEGRHLGGGGGRAVGAGRPARPRKAGDAPAPGVRRLGRAAIGIGQGIALRHIHHHERMQRHRQAARLQVAYRRDDRGVGRRAAIGRAAVHAGDEARIGIGPRQAADPPWRRLLADIAFGDARTDRAGTGAQIVAEPAHDQRHMLKVGADGLKLVERGGPVIAGMEHVAGELDGLARRAQACRRVRRQAVLGRAGDDRHGPDRRFQFADRTDDLGLDLGDAVAERFERQALEDQIGDAAIGRGVAGALPRLDQRIGRLRRRAGVDAQVDPGQIEFAPVRPDALDHGDRALAQGHGHIAEIAVGRRRHARAALAALAFGDRLLFKPRRPDHGSGQARLAIGAGHRRALLGGHRPRPGQPRALAARPAEQAPVDPVAGKRAGRRARRRPERAENAAEHAPGGLKEKGGHGSLSSLFDGREGEHAGNAPPPPGRQGRLADGMALARVDHRLGAAQHRQMLGGDIGREPEHEKIAGPHVGRPHASAADTARRQKRLAPTGAFGPVGRIGPVMGGHGAIDLAPDADDKAEAIAAHGAPAPLMAVGRAQPSAGGRQDGGAGRVGLRGQGGRHRRHRPGADSPAPGHRPACAENRES